MMKYTTILFALVTLFACNDEKESLEGKLTKTVWQQTKIEVYDKDGNLTETMKWPESTDCGGDFLRFQAEQKVSYLSNCADAGCGNWLIDGNKVEFIIAAGRIVPNLCTPENYQERYYAHDEIEIKGNAMTTTGMGFGLRLLAAQDEYEEWKTQYENGDINFKCYFVASNPLIANDVSCCADFDWQ